MFTSSFGIPHRSFGKDRPDPQIPSARECALTQALEQALDPHRCRGWQTSRCDRCEACQRRLPF